MVTGFQGVCAAGDITTLGRGGSDTTAVALAAALEAELCEIYTDVDGVYTADPRLIPEARRLDAVDSRDMLALARAVAQVLHPKSVELAMANHVPLRLLSSFTEGSGSVIRRLSDEARPRFAGITGRPEARGPTRRRSRRARSCSRRRGSVPTRASCRRAPCVSACLRSGRSRPCACFTGR